MGMEFLKIQQSPLSSLNKNTGVPLLFLLNQIPLFLVFEDKHIGHPQENSCAPVQCCSYPCVGIFMGQSEEPGV